VLVSECWSVSRLSMRETTLVIVGRRWRSSCQQSVSNVFIDSGQFYNNHITSLSYTNSNTGLLLACSHYNATQQHRGRGVGCRPSIYSRSLGLPYIECHMFGLAWLKPTFMAWWCITLLRYRLRQQTRQTVYYRDKSSLFFTISLKFVGLRFF